MSLPSPAPTDRERVRLYHERTKHQLERYARGPETLDWDSQPAPFRRFQGAEMVALPRLAEAEESLASALHGLERLPESTPLPFSLATLGALLELSLGITAWKTQGPDRWAVRANPSSGNLHPVEGYVLVSGTPLLDAGVYHYGVEDHALERRARWGDATATQPRVWLALTSVMWREAWKYGERAFRYCQLDVGHALAALRHAAALLGWKLRGDSHVGWETLHRALGLDRLSDFSAGRPHTELEEPEVLVELESAERHAGVDPAELGRWTTSAVFFGRASLIDPHPMYSWPAMQEVAVATRWPDTSPSSSDSARAERPSRPALPPAAATVILARRSAQRFDPRFVLDRATFGRLLGALAPSASAPLGASFGAPQLDLIILVHRVEGLDPGVYLLPRLGDPESALQSWLKARFQPRRVDAFADGMELLELATVPPRELTRVARTLHCHQDIAANGCFAVAMMADLDRALGAAPLAYRQLLREAGGLGHILYLQAETAGVRGTGIGCFFDDAVAEFLGLGPSPVRSVYHFSVGKPIHDPRIETQATHALSSGSPPPEKNEHE
jgi:SagB-type dehydrogenase family enzyme